FKGESEFRAWLLSSFAECKEFYENFPIPRAAGGEEDLGPCTLECGQSVAERMQLSDPWPAGFGQSLRFTTWLGCLDGYISAIDLTTFCGGQG
ncbi:hypothetical protein L345_07550, partial [Ophiophagus hannah]